MNEQELLDKIAAACRAILGGKLTGIYVHGSIAFGCFHWEASDIDFLIVVETPLTLEEKEGLIRALLALDPCAPPKGFEMSVVLALVCKPFRFPTPFELHFSNAHKARCQADLTKYCRIMNGADPDLAAHFTVIRAVGNVLWGKPIGEVFGPVPRADYWDSIRGDVEDAAAEILRDPVYYILNLCRVLAFGEEGKVLSKEQGGRWGMQRLDDPTLVRAALDAYMGRSEFRAEEAELRAFAADMLRRIQESF